MMVLKRKEIIAAALVVLIGVAGYLNWSYQDKIKVSDNDLYVETGKKLGEAQYVSATADENEKNEDKSIGTQPANPDANTNPETNTEEAPSEPVMANYFDDAKMQKEASRSKSLEILKQTAENESFDKEIRDKAQNKILETAEYTEKETAAENMARAKGYDNISIYYDGEFANVSVKKDGFCEDDVLKIQEIVVNSLGVPVKNMKITEVK